MTGLSAIAQALDITSKLRNLDEELNTAEFKIQIADLYMSLSEVKISLADAKHLIAMRDAEILSLKNIASSKMRTVSYRGYSFGIDEQGKSIGRPFCPVCEKKENLQIQITRATSTKDLCPACNAVFGSSGYPWKLPDSTQIHS